MTLLKSSIASFILSRDIINEDRKSTRLNSSHSQISYAVFCLKKKIYHEYSPWITRPVITSKLSRTVSGSRRLKDEYGSATAPHAHQLPASRIHLHHTNRISFL